MEFELGIIAKSQDDGLQILEQILPFFQPNFNITLNMIPDMGEKKDVTINLNNINYEDDWDGDFLDRRSIVWTLNFTARSYIYGPFTKSGVIKKATIIEATGDKNGSPDNRHTQPSTRLTNPGTRLIDPATPSFCQSGPRCAGGLKIHTIIRLQCHKQLGIAQLAKPRPQRLALPKPLGSVSKATDLTILFMFASAFWNSADPEVRTSTRHQNSRAKHFLWMNIRRLLQICWF